MYDDIIARPGENGAEDELLTVHSEDVAELAPALCGDDLRRLASIIGRLHDFGKATTYFQHHVRGKPVKDVRSTYHARLGAFAAFHVLNECGYDDRDCLAGLLSILRHHGRLPDTAEQLVKTTKAERAEEGSAYLAGQLSDIEDGEDRTAVAHELLQNASGGTVSWTSFRDAMREGDIYDRVLDLVGEAKGDIKALVLLVEPSPDSLPDALYDRTVRLWSVLTFADKTCSAGLEDDRRLRPEALELDDLEDAIEAKRRGLSPPPKFAEHDTDLGGDASDEATLNQLREGIRRHVKENARAFADRDDHVATLTLPTGLGKTFTGITAAYTIRDETRHEELGKQHAPRVVYALPYTSIIEQTRDVFENALNADPFGRAFTVHHYLSDTVTYPSIAELESIPDQATDDSAYFNASRFAESWRSGTVLTTFVQLFESLTGPTNARGLKLPALHDAVIILDEPQTLPKEWWPAIRYLVDLLITEYNARVVSMTATQPSLFDNAPFDVSSLLSASGQSAPPIERAAFDAVSRTTYEIDESVSVDEHTGDVDYCSHTTAGTRLVEAITGNDTNTSALAVCNTIESASTLTTATTAAATAAGARTKHIGAVYQSTLNELSASQRATESVSIEVLDQEPDTSDLAVAVLEKLGFEATAKSTEDITDWTWQYSGPSDRLLIGEFSSRYRPRDRRVLVTVATVIARSTQPFAFVSTQAVEAGVDISFSAVFRDLAPLDSLVQAAGRCNRSFEWGLTSGDVTIWSLGPTEDGAEPPANYIYPQAELTKVRRILDELCEMRGSRTVPDTAVETDAIPAYFDWVAAENEADVEDRELTHALETCQGEVLARRSLIDSGYETRDVIVAHTPVERRATKRLTELLSENSHEQAAGFELLNHLSGLRVSVPLKSLEGVTTITRIDGRPLNDPEGVNVLTTTRTGNGQFYDLADGGLRITDLISDRFSI
ncbi:MULTISPECIES: CRISPR-associated endonuclease Cas3'' [unclassified Haloferax]|uniref:CRISPR-associated endonuclease Cas3'' n=1 Tax=unclassified Haloferax TaxID=2625095 RepID=UPI002874011D|nr:MULTISPECIES: CRISPR-associated endonuclease Cas3'' [unclassified Haloferax]MDS0241383.1 CRISPR-associated endonuclease Cas3'' [Haloferax sp. S2CR25]MDS0444504.1 CRISPR-associated endonuclease Cas3'' [Haloferax sp. S2CR25-2]